MVRARFLGVGSQMLPIGNVGGRQEIRNTEQLTGMLAPFCEEGMVEGTRIILSKESKLGVGGNVLKYSV